MKTVRCSFVSGIKFQPCPKKHMDMEADCKEAQENENSWYMKVMGLLAIYFYLYFYLPMSYFIINKK